METKLNLEALPYNSDHFKAKNNELSLQDDMVLSTFKEDLAVGDFVVDRAREAEEVYSRVGKTDNSAFLKRTSSGSTTIGGDIATLKQVGGNIVKNIIDGTLESGWISHGTSTVTINGGVAIATDNTEYSGVKTTNIKYIDGHKYYASAFVYNNKSTVAIVLGGKTLGTNKTYCWALLSGMYADNPSVRDFRITSYTANTVLYATKPLLIDLTEMFGAGNEPDKDTCDKLFGTMDALPLGLTITNPTEFKSTGYNQADPSKVLIDKGIENGAIVDKVGSNLAVVPCLPCKVGVGENNGYCIHGAFDEGAENVYLTPLNPLEIEGELYMHELTKDASKGTYVPQIKGYMFVEVPNATDLCVHFLWSEDCDRNAFEPYYESKVELPAIPEMSEWGLAGIQSSGNLACDEIDFIKGVYRKKIGCIDIGNAAWKKRSDSSVFYLLLEDMFMPNYWGGISPVMSAEYSSHITLDAANLPDKKVMTNAKDGGRYLYIRDDAYTTVSAFKQASSGLKVYYILIEPEEYPISLTDSNFISYDYGTEEFNSIIPINTEILYHQRALVGETKNFLDRLYDNTGKCDSNEVADVVSKAVILDNINYSATNEEASIEFKSIGGGFNSITIPTATTDRAGVMSAIDKQALENIPNSIKEKIAEIVEIAPDTIDTLKELVEWLENNETDAAAILQSITDNANAIANEVTRAKAAEQELEERIDNIPLATTESDGLMSAEDKRRMAACNSYIVKGVNNLQDAINALNNILPYEDKVSGVMVNFVDENGNLRSFVFSSNVGGFTNPKRWIDIAGNQTYIIDDKPANNYRLSELIENIKVQANGEFDVNATYSIGQFGYAPSFGTNVAEIKKNGTRLGIIYFNNSLVGELDASNLKIVVSVKSFGEIEGVFDYSQYNRINPQLFTDAYESWKLNAVMAMSNENTTAITAECERAQDVEKGLYADINSVKDVVYESDIVAVDTIIQQGKYYNNLGRLVDDSARCCTVPFDVVAGERYYITCRIGGSTVIAYVAMWGADGEWLGVADGFIGGSGNAVDRVFIVPEGVQKVAVSSYNTTSPSVTKSIRSNNTVYYTKDETYNRDEVDRMIASSPSGDSEVDSNFINNVETITLNVEDNTITEAVVLGTGWSGNLPDGYSHISGNTEPLEFNLPYASGDKFILEFKCDGVTGDSTDLLIAVGDTPTVKSYNGTNSFRLGFVANGGRLKITPASQFASTITDIAIRKISNNGNNIVTIQAGDVYSQANSMITAFWNVAIGSKNMTLSRLINGSRNVAIGRNTLNSITSGNRNIAIGTFAMPFLTEAEENVAIGADTIYPLTKAFGCVGIGKATLAGTQKAEYCVAIGKQAMGSYSLSKDRTKCTAVGVSAGPSITDSCTHVGYRAGANVSGARNTSIGYNSMAVGDRSTVDITGSELTCVGYRSQIANTEEAKTATNSTAVGANTTITKSNQVVIGNSVVEEVVIAGKRIIFHTDGSVKWENI